MTKTTRRERPCDTCAIRDLSFCARLVSSADTSDSAELAPSSEVTVRARQLLYRAGESSAEVYVLREGWSFRFLRLPDGRRQIHSLLLPGDLVSIAPVFGKKFIFPVQALTDCRYCTFLRQDVRERIRNDEAMFDYFGAMMISELERTANKLIDLGRRSAEERIAQLIVALWKRLAARTKTQTASFEFPLRQEHIADMTGLTVVHVSRVINAFRQRQLIEIKQRVLTILDPAELSRLVSL
jgi:CRP-like cAMP-binding protein